MRVQSTRFALPSCSGNSPISRRRGSSYASCLHLHQTTGMFLLSHAPIWLLALDKTAENFIANRDAGRSYQGEIRTCRRKCAPTSTTHHPSSTEQATGVHQEGSKPTGASGKSDSVLEASTLDRPGRRPFCDGTARAFGFSGSTSRKPLRLNQRWRERHCVDQRHGKEQSALGS